MYHDATIMLCGLGGAVFAATVVTRRDAVAVVGGFLVAAFWWQPGPAWTGGIVALAAALYIARPNVEWATAACGGLLGGLWGLQLQGEGVPAPVAWLLGAAVPSVAAVLAVRRAGFAPVVLREDAAAAMGAFGLLVAMGPAVSAGWGSAAVINLEPGSGVRPGLDLSLLVLGAAVLAGGGAHALWRRG